MTYSGCSCGRGGHPALYVRTYVSMLCTYGYYYSAVSCSFPFCWYGVAQNKNSNFLLTCTVALVTYVLMNADLEEYSTQLTTNHYVRLYTADLLCLDVESWLISLTGPTPDESKTENKRIMNINSQHTAATSALPVLVGNAQTRCICASTPTLHVAQAHVRVHKIVSYHWLPQQHGQ